MRSKLLVILTVVAAVLALGVGAVLAMGASNGNNDTTNTQAAQEATATPKPDAKPWMGVVVKPTDSGNGLVIATILPDGPAGKAGLSEGDIITAVDGAATKTPDELKTAIIAHKDGDEVTVTVIKKGASNSETTDVKVTLAARPQGKIIEGGPGDLENIIGKYFDRFLGGSFKYLDDNGKTVEVEVVPGKVTVKSDNELKIDVNGDEGERSFQITSDTKVPSDLAVGENAVVIVEDGTVKLVTGTKLPFLPFFGGPGGFRHGFGNGDLPGLCEGANSLLPGLEELCPGAPTATPAPSPGA